MSESPSFRLCYENTLEDAVAINKYHQKHSPAVKRFRKMMLIFLALWIIGVNLVGYGFANIAAVLFYSLVYFVGALLLIGVLRWLVSDRMVRRIYSGDKNRAFLGSHDLELRDEGLLHRTAYSETKMAWGLIERIESTPQHTFIYTGSASALVIPHDRITDGNYAAFLQELGQRFKPDQALERAELT